jgi:hypothetical protein
MRFTDASVVGGIVDDIEVVVVVSAAVVDTASVVEVRTMVVADGVDSDVGLVVSNTSGAAEHPATTTTAISRETDRRCMGTPPQVH